MQVSINPALSSSSSLFSFSPCLLSPVLLKSCFCERRREGTFSRCFRSTKRSSLILKIKDEYLHYSAFICLCSVVLGITNGNMNRQGSGQGQGKGQGQGQGRQAVVDPAIPSKQTKDLLYLNVNLFTIPPRA